MRNSMRPFRTVAACAVVTGLLLSFGASAAMAVPATFNSPTGTGKVSGTLTVKKGASSTTCTFTNAQIFPSNSGSPLQGVIYTASEATRTKCANGNYLGITNRLLGVKNGAAFSLAQTMSGTGGGSDPFGVAGGFWMTVGYEVPWTNGSGATPSKITFSNTNISQEGMTFTGSLNVTKGDGSLLTLQ